MGLVAFASPRRIQIFLKQFVPILRLLSLFRNVSGSPLIVFVLAVTLARCIHKGGIHNRACACNKMDSLQLLVKNIEKLTHDICLGQCIPEQPDGLGIWYTAWSSLRL